MARTARHPRIFALPRYEGMIGGLLVWWASLGHSLLPRSPLLQGVVGGVCVALGVGVGELLGQIARWALEKAGRGPRARTDPGRAERWIRLSAVVLLPLGAWRWTVTQDDQRELIGLDPAGVGPALPMLVVTLLTAAIVLVIARSIGRLVLSADRFFARWMPAWVARLVAIALVVVAGFTLSQDVVVRGFRGFVDDRYAVVDDGTPAGVTRPDSPLVSGSPASLVAWEDLGSEGRRFVGQATPLADIEAFDGPGVTPTEPIRVYAGLKSAEDPQERAALVVEELARTGAFDREVLMVATATGTGWVDPVTIRAFELLRGGDTAIASMQYSYLPSWISFLVDGDRAAEAGTALFDAVYEAWSALPVEDRPVLFVFGLSLGSNGSEATFAKDDLAASIANVVDRTDAVLWMGPTHANAIHEQVIAGREPGSPAWRPVVDGGRQLVAGNRAEDLLARAGDPAPDILYVQHPSDPVTWWSMETLVSPPPWTEDPIGYDVPQDVRWWPFVTWAQASADLAAGFGSPPGHGHIYDPDVSAALAYLLPPDGWTVEDTERLADAIAPFAEAQSSS